MQKCTFNNIVTILNIFININDQYISKKIDMKIQYEYDFKLYATKIRGMQIFCASHIYNEI